MLIRNYFKYFGYVSLLELPIWLRYPSVSTLCPAFSRTEGWRRKPMAGKEFGAFKHTIERRFMQHPVVTKNEYTTWSHHTPHVL